MSNSRIRIKVYHKNKIELNQEFEDEIISLGRSQQCMICLSDNSVSKEHAIIYNESDSTWIEDRGSTNGTFINDVRIKEKKEIGSDQLIRIGPFSLVIENLNQATTKTYEISSAEQVPETNLHRDLRNMVISRIDLKEISRKKPSQDELHGIIKQILKEILQEKELEDDSIDPKNLIKSVLDEMLGLGPLQDLLEEENIDEIMVVKKNKIYVERRGRIELTDKTFSSDEAIMHIIERIVTPLGKRIDQSSPMVDARLIKGGHRVNAIIPPLALTGPTITIRKFKKKSFKEIDLIDRGSANQDIFDLLKVFVEGRYNIIISGGTGTGKTTFLNLLSSYIPPQERIVTIEDVSELRLEQEHVVTLQARPSNVEGSGEVTVRDLVINALRMRPDRIIVGECRGREALDMLQAMNTGHDGSLTTGHANSPDDMLHRLETMVMMAGTQLTTMAIREQIRSAIHVIVQLTRFSDGTRKVTEISEISGIIDGQIQTRNIAEYIREGFDPNGTVLGHWNFNGKNSQYWEELQVKIKTIPDRLRLLME